MLWEHERHVRLHTREPSPWILLPWRGQPTLASQPRGANEVSAKLDNECVLAWSAWIWTERERSNPEWMLDARNGAEV
jgi:hypothetical protein